MQYSNIKEIFPVRKLSGGEMFATLMLVLFLGFALWLNILSKKTWTFSTYFIWAAIFAGGIQLYVQTELTKIILTDQVLAYKSPFRHYSIPLDKVLILELVEERLDTRLYQTNIKIGIASTPELRLRTDSLLSVCYNSSTQFFLMYNPETWAKIQAAVKAANPEVVIRRIG